MADQVRKMSYCYLTLPNRAGQGDQVLAELERGGVDLLAFSAFPDEAGTAQMDLVAESLAPLRRIAVKNGWRVSKPKKGFLVQGADKLGAVHRHVHRLAKERINITAADAIAAGKGRYGMILWVKQKDFARAAKALRAR